MGQQYSHLSSEERILIEKLHCEQHLSIRRTAERIGRDKSTVSRELRRGLWFASNENGSYRPYRPKRLKTGAWTSGPFYSALAAQRKADLRRRGSRKPRRMDSDRLRAWVLDSLRRGWSPELIEGRLKARYAGDPYSSWQRGSNENRNGRIRRYLPKGTGFEDLAQEDLDAIVGEINDTPMKLLGYKTPNEVWDEEIAKLQSKAASPNTSVALTN